MIKKTLIILGVFSNLDIELKEILTKHKQRIDQLKKKKLSKKRLKELRIQRIKKKIVDKLKGSEPQWQINTLTH